MPVFDYGCDGCGYVFEVVVITRQHGFEEPKCCPSCGGTSIRKVVTAPAAVRMDGRIALKTLSDPHMPLRELQGKNRPDCEGGYSDLPEVGKLKRVKTDDGNWRWEEVKKQTFDMGKGKKS